VQLFPFYINNLQIGRKHGLKGLKHEFVGHQHEFKGPKPDLVRPKHELKKKFFFNVIFTLSED